MKRIFQFIAPCLIAIVLITSGCQAAQVPTSTVEAMPVSSPTGLAETPTPRAPAFVPPTQTLDVASATSEPATAAPGISGELSSPPYLAYNKVIGGQEQIFLVNQDGSGLKTIPLADNGYTYGDLSPTGEWLVFYTETNNVTTGDPSNNLALNLMHLPDGQTRQVTRLLPEDYPDNLKKLAALVQTSEPELFAGVSVERIASDFQKYFIGSVLQLAWSPSGNLLAFSGAMDGPSSDLYLYDLQTEKITRLSSGLKNIDFIRWFPDGNQILYSSSYPIACLGECTTSYYVTNLDGSVFREIKKFDNFGGQTYMDDWATRSTILLHTTANGPGTCCLRNLDLNTDAVNVLYGDSFQTYAYDPASEILALAVQYSTMEDREPGVYFVDRSGMKKVDEFHSIYYLGWPDYPFLESGKDTKLLSSTGATKTLIEQGLVPFASRNNRYIALADGEGSQNQNGLKVFDNNGKPVLDIPNGNISKVIWRLDSDGLFYRAGNQLFYVGMADKDPILIDPQINTLEEDAQYTSFGWVR